MNQEQPAVKVDGNAPLDYNDDHGLSLPKQLAQSSSGPDSGPDGLFCHNDNDLARAGGSAVGIATFQNHHDFWHTLAGIAGNVLEWYDFAIFGFFSDEIGKVFFPNARDPVAQSFAVFGGAFLFRPVGGVLLGYMGDVYGREKALRLSIFLMAFPTFAMGCLPGYNQVGAIAIVLLILIRILQGLSVGGQLMSSLVFTLEGHPVEHWGVYGSYVMAAANFGTLLGNLVATMLKETLTEEQLESWGWRLPFWSGIFVSLSGFYLRSSDDDHHVPSSQGYQQGSATNGDPERRTKSSPSTTTNPLRLALSKGNRRSLLTATMVPCLWSAGFYISFVWMATYMSELLQPPVPHSFTINAMSLLLSVCIFFPFAGSLSDRFGRRPVMTVGAVGLGLTSPILFYVIRKRNPMAAFLAQSLLGVCLSLFGAPMCAYLVESFDPAARLTSVAIGYNLAQATAGGLAPVVATLLTDDVSRKAPAWILPFLSVVALTGLWVVAPREHARFSPAPTVEMTAVCESSQEEDRKYQGNANKDDDGDGDEDEDDNELL